MVFARMSNWKFKKGKREEGLKTLDESITNNARNTNGFRGALTLLDADDPNAAVIVTLWENEEDLKASKKRVFRDTINELDKFILNSPDTKNYKLDSAELHM